MHRTIRLHVNVPHTYVCVRVCAYIHTDISMSFPTIKQTTEHVYSNIILRFYDTNHKISRGLICIVYAWPTCIHSRHRHTHTRTYRNFTFTLKMYSFTCGNKACDALHLIGYRSHRPSKSNSMTEIYLYLRTWFRGIVLLLKWRRLPSICVS